jgi:tRNA(Ile)-lysidine synthase
VARADDPVIAAAGRFLSSFKTPASLLIAVSGGSDSTGLLVALATLSATGRYQDITLSACTIDHDLRSGSADEARWVEALCARYRIPHVTRRWEGGKPVSGLQAAARAKRYDLLVDAARETGADAILAGHTSDDQGETIAMRAERAAGGVGLSGMAEAALLNGAVWLLRPFLAVERTAIRAFLRARGESWLDDPSNANEGFERVRVRNTLRADRQTADEAAAERLALSRQAGAFLRDRVCAESHGFHLGTEALDAALTDPAAWRGLLVLAAAIGGRVHPVDAASAERLKAFLASGRLSRLTAGRVVFDRRREGLHLYRECRGIRPLVVPAGGCGAWDGRYRVTNRTDRPIVIAAAGSGAGEAGFEALRGPALRAARAAPSLHFQAGGRVPEGGAVIEPILSPYGKVLPGFDLPLALALQTLFGSAAFPPQPNE